MRGDKLLTLKFALEDFARQIEQHVRPSRGRVLISEVVDGAWDWKAAMDPLNVAISGIAIVQDQKDVSHFFQLVRREHIHQFLPTQSDGEIVSSFGKDRWFSCCGVPFVCIG